MIGRMLTAWRRFHARPPLARRSLKLLIFAVALLLILFPKPWLLVTAWQRLANLDALLDPNHPGLAAFEQQVWERVARDAPKSDVLATAERVVYEAIPYRYDWDNYGVMLYIPTLAEALERGAEDCDGRAVVSASLLRRMGYDARIVCDLLHMWVDTSHGETMAPSVGQVSIASRGPDDPKGTGTRMSLNPGLVANAARGLSFGMAVFPLTRLAIITTVTFLLLLHPGSRPWSAAAGGLLLAIFLGAARWGGEGVARWSDAAVLSAFCLGAAWVLAGFWLTGSGARRSNAHSNDEVDQRHDDSAVIS